MTTARFSPTPAKRIKVQSDNNPQPTWLLVPTASRTVQDLLGSLLLRLGLPGTCSYDLCLDGAPILPNEDIALVRDGEELHLRLRHTPTATPTLSQPSSDRHMSATSTPEIADVLPKKRKRVLTSVGKRRRNARNRKREKRRRLERRQAQNDSLGANNRPPNSDQVQDPSPQNPINRLAEQEKPMVMKENGASSVPVITPTIHTNQSPITNEAADEVMPISPTDTTPHVNMNFASEQHLQAGDRSKTIPATVPSPARDDCPPSTKPCLQPADYSDDICPGVASQKPNPDLSYVFLEKVSIAPATVNLPQKDSIEKGNHSNKATEMNKGPVARASEVRSVAQPEADKTSEMIRDKVVSSAEKQTVKEALVKTRWNSSVERKANLDSTENQFILDKTNKVKTPERRQPEVSMLNAPERQQPKVIDAEKKEVGAANALELSATNTSAEENESQKCDPMETDNGGCINTAAAAAIRLACKEQVQESSRVHKGSTGEPSDKVYPSTNSRWKRRRPQGNTNKQDERDLCSEQMPPVLDDKQMPSSERRDCDRPTDTKAQHLHPRQVKNAKRSMANENASATKPTVCDIIDLVDDNEDDGKLFDNLPVLMHHPRNGENRAKSTSPQSIVIADPTGHSHAASDGIKAMKTTSLEAAKEDARPVIQADQGKASHEPGGARASRRKPARPKRLNKPETYDKVSNVNTLSNASFRDSSHEGEDREALEALKNSVVKDLQSSRPEAATENNSITQSIIETPVHKIPEANAKGASKARVRNEVKRKRKSLRGGLSTLAALRVAKAHAAIRLSSSKDINGTNRQEDGAEACEANENTADGSTAMNTTAKAVKNTVRKKRGRSRRSEKTLRYLTEKQNNKSIFVENRPETLLPPPELLELIDSQEFAEDTKVPEISPETYAKSQSYAGLSDVRKEAQPMSHDKARDNVDYNHSFGLASMGENCSNGKKSFSLEESATKTPPPHSIDQRGENCEVFEQASPAPQEGSDVKLLAEGPPLHSADPVGLNNKMPSQSSPLVLGDVERLSEEPPLHLANQAGMNNETSTEVRPAQQEWGDADREHGSNNIASTHETAFVVSPKCFREDLVHMLQNTTRTLAQVWSKWER